MFIGVYLVLKQNLLYYYIYIKKSLLKIIVQAFMTFEEYVTSVTLERIVFYI